MGVHQVVNMKSEAKKDKRKNKKKLLSPDFMVATAIYAHNIKKEVVWYGKLVEELDKTKLVSKSTIGKALDALFDFGIVKAEYGITDLGRPARLLYITNEAKPTIKKVYENFWK